MLILTIAAFVVGATVGSMTFQAAKKRVKKKNNVPAIAGIATGILSAAVFPYLISWLIVPAGIGAGVIYYLRKKEQKALPPGQL